MHVACANGHIETVKVLLNTHCDVNAVNKDGCTALFLATQNKHLQVVKMLVKRGVDVNIASNAGFSPLHVAADTSQVEVVRCLLEVKSANIDAVTKHGDTPLMLAMHVRNEAIIKHLLDAGALPEVQNEAGTSSTHLATMEKNASVMNAVMKVTDNVFFQDLVNKAVPVHYAVINNNKSVVQSLLASDSDAGVNAQDVNKNTPLHLAARLGSKDMCQLLVVEGADPLLKNKHGNTALHVAVAHNHKSIVELFLARCVDVMLRGYNEWTPLHMCAKAGQCIMQNAQQVSCDVATLLLENEAELEALGANDESVLHVAIQHENNKLCQLLLTRGISVNARMRNGWAPIHVACQVGNKDVLATLLTSKDVDVDAQLEGKIGPLYIAAMNGHVKCVVMLLANKAARVDPYALTSDGWSALHVACLNGHSLVVDTLLRMGIDAKSRAHNEQNGLHLAAMGGHEEVARALLAKGVEVNAQCVELTTALYWAIRELHHGVARLLISKGAAMNFVTADGDTCLHRAVANDDVTAVKLLWLCVFNDVLCLILSWFA